MRPIDADAQRDKLQNLADDEWNRSTTTSWAEAFNECVDMLEDAPTIEPERKTGRWIDYVEDGYVECPFCHSATNCDGNISELHFCFSCGARMEEPEDIPMEYFENGGR